jgi:hypothetical protein
MAEIASVYLSVITDAPPPPNSLVCTGIYVVIGIS